MGKLKEWLLSALGGFGFVVYFLIITFINVLPMVILDLPWWAVVLVCFALCFFEWSQFLYLGIWIWAFVVALGQPIDWVTVVFFIAFAVYFGSMIISIISALRRPRF